MELVKTSSVECGDDGVGPGGRQYRIIDHRSGDVNLPVVVGSFGPVDPYLLICILI